MSDDDHDRRSQRRRPLSLQVEYPDRQGYKIDYTESISPSGIFIRTNQKHRIGDRLRLAISLPGFPDSIHMTGEVSRIREATTTDARGIGVRIEEQEYFRSLARVMPPTGSREFSLTSGPYARLAGLPRVSLATTPTPLHRAERLSKALGGPDIWFKRDDLTGFGLGGNKVRKLELIAGDALERGCDTLVTGAHSLQSNNVRLTSAVASHLDLRCVAVVPGADDAREMRGNRLLGDLLGAEFREPAGDPAGDIDDHIAAAVEALEQEGRRPYAIALGGTSWLGCCGYVMASIEMVAQFQKLDIDPDLVVTPVGSAGTQAGLVVAQRWLDPRYEVMGISIAEQAHRCSERVAMMASEVTANLQLADTIPVDDIWVVSDYAGGGYAKPTIESTEAIRMVARLEGVFLDPVYTGKAMAGLIDLIRKGEIKKDQTVVFLHTGGWPALFA